MSKLTIEEFKEIITTELTEVKSKTGIRYTNIAVKDAITGKRESTQNSFLIDLDELFTAYKSENLNSLKSLTNDELKKKYGLFMAQSPAWAILKKVYELTEK